MDGAKSYIYTWQQCAERWRILKDVEGDGSQREPELLRFSDNLAATKPNLNYISAFYL